LDDSAKPNEETPESPAEEAKDEKVEKPQPKSEAQPEETSEEQIEEEPKTSEAKEDSVEGPEKPKKEEKPVEAEVKKETKKEEPKKKDRKDDFKYIVRIANTDLDGEKTLVRGLTSIKGIGMHMSTLIADAADIDRDIKVGDLTDAQIDKIKEALHNVNKNAPGWMLNHRRDCNTGEDIHLIGSDIDMQLRDDTNIMKKIRSYRGIRHERGLPVRGQRTRANSRRGLALGVSRKEARAASKEAKASSSEKE
jgi:small subunit ribosomal protein S13